MVRPYLAGGAGTIGFVRHVKANEGGAPSPTQNRFLHLLPVLFITVGDVHMRPRSRECVGYGLPDSGASASYERGFLLEIEHCFHLSEIPSLPRISIKLDWDVDAPQANGETRIPLPDSFDNLIELS